MTGEAGALGLICTKLRRPGLAGNLIPCQRLPFRLRAGLDRKRALVSTPADLRKTTLITETVAQAGLNGGRSLNESLEILSQPYSQRKGDAR
jgi:ATP/maltotriose-dependent transcriptional regulator MalT